MTWFSLLVLIPLVAVLISAADLGPGGFSDIVTGPQTAAALRLTVAEALEVTVTRATQRHLNLAEGLQIWVAPTNGARATLPVMAVNG